MRTDTIKVTLKAVFIGGTMLVPGGSGGTMAMLLGIYDRLIYAVSSFRKDIKGNIFFLWMFLLGGLAGMFLFSRPILYLIENFPKPSLFFFLGAVVGGVPMIVRHSSVQKLTFRVAAYVLIGIVIVFLISKLPPDLFSAGDGGSVSRFLWLMAAGVLSAVALVLPGISVSYMLLMLGLYDMTMKAITELDFGRLFPLALGLGGGILLTTRILEKAMNRHPQPTYLIILGFILSSAVEVFPGVPSGGEWILCPLTLSAGFGCIYGLSKLE